MKNADATAQAVEKVINATNLTASAALEEVKKADADESAAVAKKGAHRCAAQKTSSKKDASHKKNAPKAKQGAKQSRRPKTKAAKGSQGPSRQRKPSPPPRRKRNGR